MKSQHFWHSMNSKVLLCFGKLLTATHTKGANVSSKAHIPNNNTQLLWACHDRMAQTPTTLLHYQVHMHCTVVSPSSTTHQQKIVNRWAQEVDTMAAGREPAVIHHKHATTSALLDKRTSQVIQMITLHAQMSTNWNVHSLSDVHTLENRQNTTPSYTYSLLTVWAQVAW